MDFAQIARSFGHFINRNSTTILASTAVVGTVSTAILAGKAAREQGFDEAVSGAQSDKKEAFLRYWKLYIPAAGVGVLTVGCIVGAHTIGMRKTAAFASAAALTERAFVEYQDKVRTVLGEKKDQQVTDAIADDHIKANPIGGQPVIIGSGDHLCYEALSGRYFRSDIEKVRRLENDINATLLHGQDTVSVNDWYTALGLPHVENGDAIGWNDENLMEIRISSHLADDSTPCVYIGHANLPNGGFWKQSR